MPCFHVRFIKDNVLGGDRRCSSVVQRVISVEAPDKDEAFRKARHAFVRAERISDWHVHADRVEISAHSRAGRLRLEGDADGKMRRLRQ